MVKRLFDIMVSVLALVVLALPMMVLAVLIRLDSPGPALFCQTRVGRHGVPFRMHKFRTMTSVGGLNSPLTVANDPRITRVGRWIRDRRLDEIPQLLDVLRGRMSLVGPRPEVPRYVELYPPALRQIVLSVRPGLTDPAALAHRREGEVLAGVPNPEQHYIDHILPHKLQMQADYVGQATMGSDVLVLMRTLGVLIGSHR